MKKVMLTKGNKLDATNKVYFCAEFAGNNKDVVFGELDSNLII